ncbi:MAG: plasmid stabilization protein [Rhizorhabdus sp.]|nr:plasmid stabilization protein [Rhizorhabdus sp.]
MTIKTIVPREQALHDVEAAVDFYAREAGERVALGFVDALENAYRAIASRPAVGSPLYGLDLDLPGLRTRPIRRFPYLIFYVERDAYVDVWRVLHAKRDIPASMQSWHVAGRD